MVRFIVTPVCVAIFMFSFFAPQSAWARYTCGVKPTPDGFVALRKGPGIRFKLIARMKKGEIAGLLHPPGYEKIVRKGKWIFVRYNRGTQFQKSVNVDDNKAISGWVHGSLLECHE